MLDFYAQLSTCNELTFAKCLLSTLLLLLKVETFASKFYTASVYRCV